MEGNPSEATFRFSVNQKFVYVNARPAYDAETLDSA